MLKTISGVAASSRRLADAGHLKLHTADTQEHRSNGASHRQLGWRRCILSPLSYLCSICSTMTSIARSFCPPPPLLLHTSHTPPPPTRLSPLKSFTASNTISADMTAHLFMCMQVFCVCYYGVVAPGPGCKSQHIPLCLARGLTASAFCMQGLQAQAALTLLKVSVPLNMQCN